MLTFLRKKLKVNSEHAVTDSSACSFIVERNYTLPEGIIYIKKDGTCNWSCKPNKKTNLISGSHDGTIRIWNLNNGTCSHTIKSNTDASTIECLLPLSDNEIASGSRENTIYKYGI